LRLVGIGLGIEKPSESCRDEPETEEFGVEAGDFLTSSDVTLMMIGWMLTNNEYNNNLLILITWLQIKLLVR